MNVNRYKGTPEYARGYADAFGGYARRFDDPGYADGHAAGQRAVKIFEQHGMKRTGRDSFGVTLR